jgi:uncharacterized Tic20 family protein
MAKGSRCRTISCARTAEAKNGEELAVQSDQHGVIEEQDHKAMSAQDERTWSILAHLSMFLNLITGFLGPVAALIFWLVYRDRSPKVAFHALQSMWYQIGWLAILAVGWTATALLMVLLIGFVLIPVMAIVSVIPFVQAGYAAHKVSNGEDYRYPFAANLVESR